MSSYRSVYTSTKLAATRPLIITALAIPLLKGERLITKAFVANLIMLMTVKLIRTPPGPCGLEYQAGNLIPQIYTNSSLSSER